MSTRRLWTNDEDEFLIEHYAENFNEDLALALERTVSSVHQRARALGLKKSSSFVRLVGGMSSSHPNSINSRFKKGHTSSNKGQKMPEEVRQKVARTFFQKGHQPHNTRPEGDGAISKRKEYWYIRIGLGKWRQLHTHIWEQANRPINPKTEMVIFKDGNRDNCQLDNLELIDRAANMKRNTIHRYPDDIKNAIWTVAKLNKVIKKIEHEEQDSTRS